MVPLESSASTDWYCLRQLLHEFSLFILFPPCPIGKRTSWLAEVDANVSHSLVFSGGKADHYQSSRILAEAKKNLDAA